MTSRIELVINPHSKSYSIHELSTEAACQVLEYGEQLGQALLTNAQKLLVANKTGNVPLALSIFKSLLGRVGAPPPEGLIRELESPIEALSPRDFQIHKQVNATLCMSYNYLSPKLQLVSRQLTLFPGSFSREAGVVVLSNNSQLNTVQKDIEESLTLLVRNSLLQYDQRRDRYQYHQLIKEYFMHISSNNDTVDLYPVFYIHYAMLLNSAYKNFSQNFEVGLAIIDSDRHNFHHLLNALNNISGLDTYFLVIVGVILDSVNAGLLNVRYPKDDLCAAMMIAIYKFDEVIILDTIVRLAGIENFEYSSLYSGRADVFFHYYVLLMTHLQTCKKKNSTLSMHDNRRDFIEGYRYHMNHTDYIEFNKHLIKHYSHVNDTEKAKECRMKIMIQVGLHEFICPWLGECTYDSVGSASYEIGEYPKAAILFEKALEEEKDGMKIIRILSNLVHTYAKLSEYDKMFETADRLCVQYGIRSIMNSSVSELFWNYNTVAGSLNLCEEFGLIEQASVLFKNYTEVLMKILDRMEDCNCEDSVSAHPIPSNELVYTILERMYDVEYYEAVIKIGSRGVEIFSKLMMKNDSIDSKMLSYKLKFQVLVGKSRFCGGNLSGGMKDFEDILHTILNLEDRIAVKFAKEKKTACLYLIPQIMYIWSCYSVTSPIHYVIAHLIFNPVYYRLGTQIFAHLCPQHSLQSEKVHAQHVQLLSSSTDLQIISVEFIEKLRLLYELWLQAHSEDIKSSFFSIASTSCQIPTVFKVVMKLIMMVMDVHLLWAKLIFPYIVYIYLRQPHLFTAFIVELQFWYLAVPYEIIMGIFTMPKQTVKCLLIGPGILQIMRDPRYMYGDTCPHAMLLMDTPYVLTQFHVFNLVMFVFIHSLATDVMYRMYLY